MLGAQETMKRIAAITFDLWDTLIQEYPGGSEKVSGIRTRRIGQILDDRGIPCSAEQVGSAYTKTADFLNMTWSRGRDVPIRDHVLFMLNCIDGKLAGRLGHDGVREIERIYAESILDSPPGLLPGAKDALRDARGRAGKMGLISNTGRTPGAVLRVLMKEMGILEYFDTTTFSNETLVRKPSQGAFRITLEKLRAVPKASVHIGDDSSGDIAGAKGFGMRAIQVADKGKTRSPLADAYAESLSEVAHQLERL